MVVSSRTQAEIRYSNAQLAERAARESNDLRGIDAAKVEQVAAMDEIARIDEGRVTLVCANPSDFTDVNGIAFVDGRAEGVKRSVAAEYVRNLDGYAMEEGGGAA